MPTSGPDRVRERLWLCAGLIAALACLSACGAARPQPGRSEQARAVAPLVAEAERAIAEADYDTAIASYRKAYARTPWNIRLKRALAAAYAERAAAERDRGGLTGLRAAERDLGAALELLPDEPALLRSLAVVLVEQAALELDPVRAGVLRETARTLAPDVVEAAPLGSLALERRLDLAHELAREGRLEAALDDLERLHAVHPEHTGVTLLLARTQVRQGGERAAGGQYQGAGVCFERALELYAGLENCATGACEPEELALAHQNRITAWLNANRRDEARRALEDAERAGLRFPELRRALGEY